MKLEDIGFYTLSDKRAENVSWESDLQRCELILTDRCNFKCKYCRGIKKELRGDITLDQAKHIVNLWSKANLHNIRFSGGEPTIWPNLIELVKYTNAKCGIEHIALSTNGSASIEYYDELFEAGVNDFSISLDACCSSTADKMAGTNSSFDHISEVIKYLSKKTYCTVGVVLDDRNITELKSIIDYATNLGVSDIRIIPSAQYNQKLNIDIETKYPILNYRLNNIKNGRHVRGLSQEDCHKCHLVKDDMVILSNYHFPCIIYMREQGNAIGSIDNKSIEQIRAERKIWYRYHDSYSDIVCRNNCLDVCLLYNNKVMEN
jgi:sulfatase maturation enzyme AslB (radical SAM superfamily)